MRILSFIVLIILSINSWAQGLKTEKTTDWNTLRAPGFYESHSSNITNAPTTIDWLWGINIAHSINADAVNLPYHYGAQILFPIKNLPTMIPEMYIRSTNQQGEGLWAKVLHSKGNHAIDGRFSAREVVISITAGADHVFSSDYPLMPLKEVETFVKENNHLPDIPSEKQMQENGLNLNDMQIKLLQKIEELTLYVIEQDKRIKSLEEENKNLKSNQP